MSLDVTPDPEKTAEINSASEKLRELIAKRPPPCAETRRQAATFVAASLASSMGGQATPPPVRPEPTPTTRPARLGLALLLVAALAGCSVDAELRRSIEVIERKWPVIRDASAPAAGISSESFGAATAAMDRAVTSAGDLSRVE